MTVDGSQGDDYFVTLVTGTVNVSGACAVGRINNLSARLKDWRGEGEGDKLKRLIMSGRLTG